MQPINGRIIQAALFMLLIVHLSCAGRSAGAPDSILLTVDGDPFTTDDFLTWWDNIREPDMEPPETPQPFIDWTLLYREAESMGLQDDQTFMKKVSTFHKVRSLMLLKNEEVDARINITDEEIRQHYAENYVPVWVLRILHFADAEKAETAWRKLKSGEITEEELARTAPEEGGPLARNIVRQRPNSTHVEWLEIIRRLEINGYSEPVPWKGDFVLLRLLEKREDDENDLDVFREEIRHRLWKQKQGQYTFALLEKLKEKYQVKIHADVVEQIDPDSLDGPFGDSPVVTTAIGNITEGDFVAMLRKEVQFRNTSGFADEADFDLKNYVLNGIINQTLTSHEALERQYEKRPPYDKIYEYYVRHRLIKALEAHVFEPEVRIGPEEVTAYYENHTDEFTFPETVKLGIIEGEEDELKALWTDIVAGSDDFMIMARINAPPGTKPVVEMAVDELEPEIARIVSGLAPGDVSRVVRVKDKFVLVQLLERTKPVIAPQEKAGRMIIADLRARQLEEVRNKYLAQLRAATDVQVNEKAWRNLREKISGNDEKTK